MERLDGRTALISAAANGIGRAAALRLAALGADIAAIDLDGAGLASLAQEVSDLGCKAVIVTGDCCDDAALADSVTKAGETFGKIDILVNNVGRSAREKAGPFLESNEACWRQVIDISLFAAMRATRLVAPGMKARGGGRIINVSSDAALVGDVGLADYCAAKAGLIGFTRSLARELAPYQVTVNALCFGAIRTKAHDTLNPEILETLKRQIPMGYVAEPEDAAHPIGFLAGDGARYITGQSIAVNGGRWFL